MCDTYIYSHTRGAHPRQTLPVKHPCTKCPAQPQLSPPPKCPLSANHTNSCRRIARAGWARDLRSKGDDADRDEGGQGRDAGIDSHPRAHALHTPHASAIAPCSAPAFWQAHAGSHTRRHAAEPRIKAQSDGARGCAVDAAGQARRQHTHPLRSGAALDGAVCHVHHRVLQRRARGQTICNFLLQMKFGVWPVPMFDILFLIACRRKDLPRQRRGMPPNAEAIATSAIGKAEDIVTASKVRV